MAQSQPTRAGWLPCLCACWADTSHVIIIQRKFTKEEGRKRSGSLAAGKCTVLTWTNRTVDWPPQGWPAMEGHPHPKSPCLALLSCPIIKGEIKAQRVVVTCINLQSELGFERTHLPEPSSCCPELLKLQQSRISCLYNVAR